MLSRTSLSVVTFLGKAQKAVSKHPPYVPILIPHGYVMFLKLTVLFKRPRLEYVEDIRSIVMAVLTGL